MKTGIFLSYKGLGANLLHLSYCHEIAKKFGHKGLNEDSIIIDRSLDSSKFREATNFQPSSWKDMVAKMKEFG